MKSDFPYKYKMTEMKNKGYLLLWTNFDSIKKIINVIFRIKESSFLNPGHFHHHFFPGLVILPGSSRLFQALPLCTKFMCRGLEEPGSRPASLFREFLG